MARNPATSEAATAPPAGNLPEYTVSEISVALKRTVEDAYGQVRVRGEISGFKRAASGHLYFSLKDAEAVLDAVCWRGTSGRLALAPEDGMEVIASGRVTTYAGRSKYQIVVEALELAGEGALLKLLEERRKKLAAEGLFDQDRKRPLPYLPEVIGVVTSPTGAVIRDILHRLADRCPRHVLLWPTLVQGDGAAEQVAAAIEGFNRLAPGGAVPRPDLLIVARGGGSLEDLWAFNEEIVVRAAASSEIPLISAVGHETDTTLIDFAADRRAPTPTAAAEIAVPVRAELMADILDSARRMIGAVNRLVDERWLRIEGLARGLPEPKRLLESAAQTLDDRAERLVNAARNLLGARRQEVERLGAGLGRRALLDLLARGRETLAGLGARLSPSAQRILADAAARVEFLARRLEGVSYDKILARGFALVRDAGDRLVASAAATRPGMDVRIGFHDGEVAARIAGPAGAVKKTAAARKKKRDPSDGGAQGSLL